MVVAMGPVLTGHRPTLVGQPLNGSTTCPTTGSARRVLALAVLGRGRTGTPYPRVST